MPRRRKRVPVVLDTNVILGFYLSRSRESPNRLVVKLWRDRRNIQLILSDQLYREYLDVLARLNVAPSKITRLAKRLGRRQSVTFVNLGGRPSASRDPEDNLVLATAAAGKAKFLVTNDRDLLDIPKSQRNRFKFEIVTPRNLIGRLKE